MKLPGWIAWVALAGAGCGGRGGLRSAGEPCVASSECAAGLLCDLAGAPPVCADRGSVDAAPPPDAGRPDGAARDAPVDPPPDAAVDAAVDAAPDAAVDAPPDASPDAA